MHMWLKQHQSYELQHTGGTQSCYTKGLTWSAQDQPKSASLTVASGPDSSTLSHLMSRDAMPVVPTQKQQHHHACFLISVSKLCPNLNIEVVLRICSR
jgi:hypothetical protein